MVFLCKKLLLYCLKLVSWACPGFFVFTIWNITANTVCKTRKTNPKTYENEANCLTTFQLATHSPFLCPLSPPSTLYCTPPSISCKIFANQEDAGFAKNQCSQQRRCELGTFCAPSEKPAAEVIYPLNDRVFEFSISAINLDWGEEGRGIFSNYLPPPAASPPAAMHNCEIGHITWVEDLIFCVWIFFFQVYWTWFVSVFIP